MRPLRTLFIDKLNGFGRNRDLRTAGTRATKRIRAICKLCNIAVANVFESLGDVRFE